MLALRPLENRRVQLLLLFAWCFVLRSPTFLVPTVDWDESIYVLMASDWLVGHAPYTTVFDHKPLGIYAIFAAALSMFGESMIAIRLVTTLAVYATSLVLYLLARRLFENSVTASVAAVLYPVFTLGLQGLSSNTELFFILCNVGGLSLLLVALEHSGRRRWLLGGAAGLAFGAALQIKYLVVIEIAVLASYVLWRNRRNLLGAPGFLLPLALGALLPTAAAGLYFVAHDLWADFLFANFEANRRYLDSTNPADLWRGLRHSTQDWFKWNWVALLTAVVVHYRTKDGIETSSTRGFLFVWLLAGFAESWATLKFFNHYSLVTLPPICLLVAGVLGRYYVNAGNRRVFALALSIVIAFPLYRTFDGYYASWLTDYARHSNRVSNVADYLRGQVSPGEYIYVVNDQPIIYFLVRARWPTKYVLPPNMIAETSSAMAGLNFHEELDNILHKRPRFVIIRELNDNNSRVEEIRKRISADYVLDANVGDATVYRLRLPVNRSANGAPANYRRNRSTA